MNIFLYVLDTLADWEISYLVAEINSGRYFKKDIVRPKIVKVGNDLKAIKTMGGIEIKPDIDVDNLNLTNNDLLLLPGGDTWLNGKNQKIIDFIKKNESINVAAICGATMALAENGLLDNRRHTSNDLGYLKMVCKNYMGQALYEYKPAVAEKNLITASGIAPLEFSYEVLKKLDVMKSDTLEAWYGLYKFQEAKYFFALMKSME